MTCIVGVVHDGNVFIGGDSAAIYGMGLTIRKDPKVFRNGPFLIGSTTSFRMAQLLRFRLHVEIQEPDTDDFAYMATAFVDSVRACLHEFGWMGRDEERESGGEFLVGYKGELYLIYSDFQVEMSTRPYAAIGCGAAYALGALHGMCFGELGASYPSGSISVEAALNAAVAFSNGVYKPYVIEEL